MDGHLWSVVYFFHCECTKYILNSSISEPPSVSMGMELKGVGPGMVSVSERGGGEGHGQLPRPRAFSQSAMHNLERSERGNPQALAELAQVLNAHLRK